MRGWKTFTSGALCVGIGADGHEIELVPYINQGPRGGFHHDEGKKKSIAMPASPDAIGALCREAIALAR